ncbi:hypothetical protein [Micromonospora aurantiaca]|uniref:hypothetical protein n=1 Tax=Micromonospora aurantiaca (nom. illeg.) TaxID=47850 RepID=UPI001E3E8297|nr:hypothetical protein [Micromonospora aurantiaca]UFN93295.1 hypothetical protein LF814_25435 [Micromonospora aurantiaca]
MLAVILAVMAFVGWRWWHNHPPYGPEALAIKSSLQFVSHEEAQAALGEKVNAPVSNGRDQLVLGRVSWQTPPTPLDGGYFAIFLIDKRTNLKPGSFSASPRQEAVSVGSAGVENKIPERYPWLQGAGDVKEGNSWWSYGSRLAVSDGNASPLTFVAPFPYVERPLRAAVHVPTAPVEISDLLLALVIWGRTGRCTGRNGSKGR